MAHTLTLQVSDDIYEALVHRARQAGQEPDQLALEWLATALQTASEDPLLQLAGAFECELTDVSERHDAYLSRSLEQELRAGDAE